MGDGWSDLNFSRSLTFKPNRDHDRTYTHNRHLNIGACHLVHVLYLGLRDEPLLGASLDGTPGLVTAILDLLCEDGHELARRRLERRITQRQPVNQSASQPAS